MPSSVLRILLAVDCDALGRPPARGGATLGEGDASTWKAESVQLARFGVSLRHGKPRDDLPASSFDYLVGAGEEGARRHERVFRSR
jgi:hypothetical protein